MNTFEYFSITVKFPCSSTLLIDQLWKTLFQAIRFKLINILQYTSNIQMDKRKSFSITIVTFYEIIEIIF